MHTRLTKRRSTPRTRVDIPALNGDKWAMSDTNENPEPNLAPGLDPHPGQPLSNDPIALEILRGTSRMLIDAGLTPISEFTLPNGRRADIAALDRNGNLIIVEIKSSLADFRSDHKWPEYAQYCDQFFFAVKPEFPRDVLPEACGLILADRYAAEILRGPASAPPLPAARRKVLLLRFARTAALRLAAASDPGLKVRSEASDI